jgi:hypothetical protein
LRGYLAIFPVFWPDAESTPVALPGLLSGLAGPGFSSALASLGELEFF